MIFCKKNDKNLFFRVTFCYNSPYDRIQIKEYMMAWFVAALILFIAELFVGSFYLLIISFSLVGAGLAAFLFEHSAVPILTAVMIASVGLYWVQRYSKRHKNQAEAVHDDLDIGQTVQIVRHLHDQIYEVFYRGSYWQARVMNTTHLVAAHTTASIVGKESNTLLIDV